MTKSRLEEEYGTPRGFEKILSEIALMEGMGALKKLAVFLNVLQQYNKELNQDRVRKEIFKRQMQVVVHQMTKEDFDVLERFNKHKMLTASNFDVNNIMRNPAIYEELKVLPKQNQHPEKKHLDPNIFKNNNSNVSSLSK